MIKGSTDPVAALLSFQITSGSGTGAFAFPTIPGTNLLVTYQATPALVGVTVAYDPGSLALTKVASSHGVVAGGTTVHLTGTGLVEVGSVVFGSKAATSFTGGSGPGGGPPGCRVGLAILEPCTRSGGCGSTRSARPWLPRNGDPTWSPRSSAHW